jgi:hypothetical protein
VAAPLRCGASAAMLATEFDDEGPNMSDSLYVLAASYDDVEDALSEYEAIEVAYRPNAGRE